MDRPASRSTKARASISKFGLMGHIPPPPAGPSLASRQMMPDPEPAPAPSAGTGRSNPRPAVESNVYPFDAEIELAELDDRGKAGVPWSARSRTLSRSGMTISSRRMCYPERRVLVAVHRVDDEPAVLLGRVSGCRYESDGLHLIELELLPMSDAGVRLSFSRRAGSA